MFLIFPTPPASFFVMWWTDFVFLSWLCVLARRQLPIADTLEAKAKPLGVVYLCVYYLVEPFVTSRYFNRAAN